MSRQAEYDRLFEAVTYPESRDTPEPVFVNKLDIRDVERLAEAEALAVFLRLNEGLPPSADYKTLEGVQEIHRHTLQDIYEWAGKPRGYPTARKEMIQGQRVDASFAGPDYIAPLSRKLLTDLAAEDHLKGLSPQQFSERAAHYVVELNNIHPFIEGNGRVQRIWLQQVAAGAGYEFDIGEKDIGQWYNAARWGYHMNNDAMRDLINGHLSPSRENSGTKVPQWAIDRATNAEVLKLSGNSPEHERLQEFVENIDLRRGPEAIWHEGLRKIEGLTDNTFDARHITNARLYAVARDGATERGVDHILRDGSDPIARAQIAATVTAIGVGRAAHELNGADIRTAPLGERIDGVIMANAKSLAVVKTKDNTIYVGDRMDLARPNAAIGDRTTLETTSQGMSMQAAKLFPHIDVKDAARNELLRPGHEALTSFRKALPESSKGNDAAIATATSLVRSSIAKGNDPRETDLSPALQKDAGTEKSEASITGPKDIKEPDRNVQDRGRGR